MLDTENRYWLETDIDGNGIRWWLVALIPAGTDDYETPYDQFAFIDPEGYGFRAATEHYQSCRRIPLDAPGIVQDSLIQTVNDLLNERDAIANKERWCEPVHCPHCGHAWTATQPWHQEGQPHGYSCENDQIECPSCRKKDAGRTFSREERAVSSIFCALVDEMHTPGWFAATLIRDLFHKWAGGTLRANMECEPDDLPKWLRSATSPERCGPVSTTRLVGVLRGMGQTNPKEVEPHV